MERFKSTLTPKSPKSDGDSGRRVRHLIPPLASLSRVASLLLVLVRSLDPDERLRIDHVFRTEVALVPQHARREVQQARVGGPVRARRVGELHAVLTCG